MLRNRFLILLGGCLLASSAAWADEVGYVDCSNHPDEIQVFAKARKTPDLVASLPCGERFTVLVYGFVFSRIQTRDGNVGYVYSNLIAVDRAATAAQQAGSTQLASAKVKIPSANAPVARPAPAASIQAQPAPPRPAAAQAPEPASSVLAELERGRFAGRLFEEEVFCGRAAAFSAIFFLLKSRTIRATYACVS